MAFDEFEFGIRVESSLLQVHGVIIIIKSVV
jgi:hypothetical protein